MSLGQVSIVTGTSGSGKTAGVVSWLVEYFFVRPHLGVLITNIPLNLDRLREYFNAQHAAGRCQVTGDDVVKRVKVLPPEWRMGWLNYDLRYAPKKCLEGVEGSYRIVLDEVQAYFGADSPHDWQQAFIDFVNTARHGGGTVQLMTQSFEGIPAAIRSSAEVEITVVSAKTRRDGLFGIPFREWYNLRASFTRKWVSAVWFDERMSMGGKRRDKPHCTRFVLDDWIFSFYGSNSAVEGSQRSMRTPEDWEVMSRTQYWRLFLRTNFQSLVVSKVTLLILICVVVFGGPLSWASRSVMAGIPAYAQQMAESAMPKAVKDAEQKKARDDELKKQQPARLPAGLPAAGPAQPAAPPAMVDGVTESWSLLSSDGVWIDGSLYVVGDVLPSGATIETIDFRSRSVRTDRGVCRPKSRAGSKMAGRIRPPAERSSGAAVPEPARISGGGDTVGVGNARE